METQDYLIDEIAEDFNVSKKFARKLFINAIMYNVVKEEVYNQIYYFLKNMEEDTNE